MGSKISMNEIGLGGPVLSNAYYEKNGFFPRFYGIDFSIKYNRDYFLSISVGEIQASKPYEIKEEAINDLCNVISNMTNIYGQKIGKPLARFNISDDGYLFPEIYWSFYNQLKDVEELRNNTFFTDNIPEDLIIYEEQIPKVLIKK